MMWFGTVCGGLNVLCTFNVCATKWDDWTQFVNEYTARGFGGAIPSNVFGGWIIYFLLLKCGKAL